MDGWIKIHRKIIEWEWYQDIPCKVLALHYILSANYEERKWKNEVIGRGQLVVGRKELSAQIGLSEQQIRTANKKLSDCGFCNVQSTNKYSIVTICKYNIYQINEEHDQPTNNQQSTNNQPATQPTNNHDIRKKEERNKEIPSNEGIKKEPEGSSCSPEFQKFEGWIKRKAPFCSNPKNFPSQITEAEFFKLKEKYSGKQIADIIEQIENRKDLRKRYTNLYRTVLNWAKKEYGK